MYRPNIGSGAARLNSFFLTSAAPHGVGGAGAFFLLGRRVVSVTGAEGGPLEGTGYGGRRRRLWTRVGPFSWITSVTAPAGGTLCSHGGPPPTVSNKFLLSFTAGRGSVAPHSFWNDLGRVYRLTGVNVGPLGDAALLLHFNSTPLLKFSRQVMTGDEVACARLGQTI
ncbi:unnamed protein product, partial [Pleuronectes platessa]